MELVLVGAVLATGSSALQASAGGADVQDGKVPFGVGRRSASEGGGGYPLDLGTIYPGTGDDGYPLVFPLTRVAANGGSLRNCSSTGINLVGMPPGSMVVRAYLYWTWVSLAAPAPGLHDTLVFGRIPRIPPGAGGRALPCGDAAYRARTVTGTLVGFGGDPCWLGGGNFVYRADVTALIAGGRTYVVWLPVGAGARNFTDPWGFPGPVAPLCEGVSLVVVYTNAVEPMGTTYIHDSGLSGSLFFSDPGVTYTLAGFFHPGTEARWIDIGADGQSGGGYPDFFALGQETTTFAFAAIAGPGSLYNDSDWNGSANKPLGQLWDTSGHDVTPYLAPGAGMVPISVTGPAGGFFDCLVPVCNVLWMR